jgi:hypothetical protein
MGGPGGGGEGSDERILTTAVAEGLSQQWPRGGVGGKGGGGGQESLRGWGTSADGYLVGPARAGLHFDFGAGRTVLAGVWSLALCRCVVTRGGNFIKFNMIIKIK